MEMGMIQSLIYGFLSGLAEILPVSAKAHQTILLTIFGEEKASPLMTLFIHLGTLCALYICCREQIRKMLRQYKLSRIPKHRRKRPLDVRVMMDLRLLRTVAIPVLLAFLLTAQADKLNTGLSWIAGMSILNALILFVPGLLPTGNKDTLSITPVESILMGIGCGAGVLPGISSMGTMLSVASVTGVDRTFALGFAELILMVVAAIRSVFSLAALFAGGALGSVGGAFLAAVTAFGGVYLGVYILRAMLRRHSCQIFAFYSLAVALLAFIFYLVV